MCTKKRGRNELNTVMWRAHAGQSSDKADKFLPDAHQYFIAIFIISGRSFDRLVAERAEHMWIHIIMWHVNFVYIVYAYNFHVSESLLNFAQWLAWRCFFAHSLAHARSFRSLLLSRHSPGAESNRKRRRWAGEAVVEESSNWLYWFVSIVCVWIGEVWVGGKKSLERNESRQHSSILNFFFYLLSQISNPLAWRLGTALRTQRQYQVSTPNVERAHPTPQSRLT